MNYSGNRQDPFRKKPHNQVRRRQSPEFLRQDKPPEKPKKKKPGFGPVIFLLAVTFIIGGLSLFYFYLITPPAKPEAEQEEKNLPIKEDVSAGGYDFVANPENRNILYLKPDFAVNLHGLDGTILFRVKIHLEVSSLNVAQELNDDRAKFYRMMDDITRTLMSWSYSDLSVGNGMELVKSQLRDRINQFLTSGRVVRVLFINPVFKRLLPTVALPPGQ